MSSPPAPLYGFEEHTGRPVPLYGVDEPSPPRVHTPLSPQRVRSRSCSSNRRPPIRNRTETDYWFLSQDSESELGNRADGDGFLSAASSAQWDDYDLNNYRSGGESPPRRPPPPIGGHLRAGRANMRVEHSPNERRSGQGPGSGQIVAAGGALADDDEGNNLLAGRGESTVDQALLEGLCAVETACTVWEDDYSDLTLEEVPLSYLQVKADECDQQKKILQTKGPQLIAIGGDAYPPELKRRVDVARRGFSTFHRSALRALAQAEDRARGLGATQTVVTNGAGIPTVVAQPAPPAGPPPPPMADLFHVNVKKPIVRENLSVTMAQIASVMEAAEAMDMRPKDEREFRAFVANVNATIGQISSIKTDSTGLVDQAGKCGMIEEMKELNKSLSQLKALEDKLRVAEQKIKCEFGSFGDSVREYVGKPPTFCGDAGKGLDYYSFRREWKEYKRQKDASKHQLLRILVHDCLTGPAKSTCRDLETEEAVFRKLKKMFGNASHLIAAKVEDIHKLKRCEGSAVKKREWLIEVNHKLRALEKLAVEHDIDDQVYHSPLIEHVHKALPPEWYRGYKKYVKKKQGYRYESDVEDSDDADSDDLDAVPTRKALSMKSRFKYMIKYLTNLITEVTFDMDFDLNTSKAHEDDKGAAHPRPSQQKPPKEKSYTVVQEPDHPEPVKGSSKKSEAKPKADEPAKKKPAKKKEQKAVIHASYREPEKKKCDWCKESHTFAFYCKEFQKADAVRRLKMCYSLKLCFKCLRLDAVIDLNDRKEWWKNHRPDCQTEWACPTGNCPKKFDFKQTHFLVCTWHSDENAAYEKKFISTLDPKLISPDLKFFTMYPAFFSYPESTAPVNVAIEGYEVEPDIPHRSIFMVHDINVNGQSMLVFYDSGCLTAAISDRAAKILRSTCVREGPTTLGVAGGESLQIPHGDEQFALPLQGDKAQCLITGLRMDAITSDFPTWNIKEAWPEISEEIRKAYPHQEVPTPPVKVGGRPVDLMLGIRYVKYFPRLLYILPSGLAVYQSKLRTANDEDLVLAGPHKSWYHALKETNMFTAQMFFTKQMRAFYFENRVLSCPISNLDYDHDQLGLGLRGVGQQGLDYDLESTIDCVNEHCDDHKDVEAVIDHMYSLKVEAEKFFDSEKVGSEITYRCLRCRACQQCRSSDQQNEISLREEREQFLIDTAVSFDPVKKRLFASLPFIQDPDECLTPNRHIAERILASQLKITNSNEEARIDVIAAHDKLRSRGHVVKVSELDPEERNLIIENGESACYFIPWRMVWNPKSLSTPTRMVFDASSSTPNGSSLNNILAKGENKLSKLFHVLLRFRAGAEGYTADVSMAYNNVYLRPEYLKYQLYLWREDLDCQAPVEVFVIKTLIYGVRPSGNLMMSAFQVLADFCKVRYPVHVKGAEALTNAYVDDLLHSAVSKEAIKNDANSLVFVLSLANMSVKGITFSGLPPPPEMSADGETVGLLGMVWHTQEDTISANAKPIYFGKPKRGKLPELVEGDLKPALAQRFTKRTVLSKFASLFDVVGCLAPLSIKYKLDFSKVCELKTDWDQPLPEEYLDTWVRNIEEIQEVKEIRFRRSVIPPGAASTELEIIISVDASQWAAAAVAHARVPLKEGGYSVQFLCARTKVTKSLTIPKAELRAVVMGASLGHMLKHVLGERCGNIMFVTDSSVALMQINQDSRPMETFTRNAVIEVRRLTKPEDWFHVESALNIADLATKNATIDDVGLDSEWQCGKQWMKLPRDLMPIRTASQITMAAEARRMASEDLVNLAQIFTCAYNLHDKVSERYSFSQYLYDPNRYNWQRAVRVMAYVLKFIRLCYQKLQKDYIPVWAPPVPPPHATICSTVNRLTAYDIRFGEHYYYHVATKEVVQFTSPKLYVNDTVVKYGIMFYTARIMDGQSIDTPLDEFIDLEPLSFVKPVADRFSPIAYSIMMFAHASDVHHRTASNTLNESRSLMFIFHGRNLANEIRAACQNCRRYKARCVQVEMGKLDPVRLTIAPPFYISQVDLMGPYIAHCEHNHRATVKVWFCVFKCVSSCAVAAHVMQSYSAAAVVQAYTRFGTTRGHPALLIIDQGTQLISACENMQITVLDLAEQLSAKYQVGVQYKTVPARAHNYNGMVERSIREIKKLLDCVFKGMKNDMLTWETCLSWVCNELNNMPICLGSRTTNLDGLDVITPSRLILGRANRRAMSGYPRLDKPSRLIQQQDRLYDLWWKVWRQERVADFVPQPSKWKHNSRCVQVDDIVIFVKETAEDHFGTPVWKLGRVISVEHSADGLIRTCTIEYTNAANPKLFLKTRVSVRHVAIVHAEDDLDLVHELNHAAKAADDLKNYYNG